uniref:Metal ion-binding protein n=1 Tax=Sesuvium portulacastrum TaxID=221166 RepID=A0A2I7ZAT8_SESPO|nr:metal ion-binding protein [Sesuvium portulacastrum]
MSFELDKFNREPFNPNEISRQLLITKNSLNFCVSHRERTPVFKFIVKGSIRPYSRVTIYQGVLKSPENSIVAEFASLLDDSDINVAELTAIRHALLMFERSDLCRKADLIVETDSSNAISWIKSDFGNPWEVQPLVNEIKLALGRIRNADVHCNYGGHGAKIINHLVDKLLEHRFERNRILEHWYWIGQFY